MYFRFFKTSIHTRTYERTFFISWCTPLNRCKYTNPESFYIAFAKKPLPLSSDTKRYYGRYMADAAHTATIYWIVDIFLSFFLVRLRWLLQSWVFTHTLYFAAVPIFSILPTPNFLFFFFAIQFNLHWIFFLHIDFWVNVHLPCGKFVHLMCFTSFSSSWHRRWDDYYYYY